MCAAEVAKRCIAVCNRIGVYVKWIDCCVFAVGTEGKAHYWVVMKIHMMTMSHR